MSSVGGKAHDSEPDSRARPMIELFIDHAAIAHNIRVIRSRGTAQLMAVIKADGFNHGAFDIARTAQQAGSDWFGMATVDEAIALREAGFTRLPVLCWLVDPFSRLHRALELDVTLSAPNIPTLDAVSAAATELGITAPVHIQLDTGMARGGVDPGEWSAFFSRAVHWEERGAVRVMAIWSHLAKAADPSPAAVSEQERLLQRGIDEAVAYGLNPALSHLANSAAALAHETTHRDIVRVGASLYGIEAVRGEHYGLRSSIRLISRISQLHRVPADTGVGYDHRHVTERATVLGVVPIGYADGIHRGLEGKAEVMVAKRRCPMVGAVSMDQIVVDLGPEGAELGDEVLLLGDANRGEPDVAEWARLLGTVEQEILTAFGSRVVRRHVNLPGESASETRGGLNSGGMNSREAHV